MTTKYNYNNVLKCIDMINNINITAKRKKDHYAIYNNVKKTYDFCYDMTQCILFEYDFNKDMMKYKESVNNNLDITKKELDKICKLSINYLKYQINEILKIINR